MIHRMDVGEKVNTGFTVAHRLLFCSSAGFQVVFNFHCLSDHQRSSHLTCLQILWLVFFFCGKHIHTTFLVNFFASLAEVRQNI